MKYCFIIKEMSSLYFGVHVLNLFAGRAREFDIMSKSGAVQYFKGRDCVSNSATLQPRMGRKNRYKKYNDDISLLIKQYIICGGNSTALSQLTRFQSTPRDLSDVHRIFRNAQLQSEQQSEYLKLSKIFSLYPDVQGRSHEWSSFILLNHLNQRIAPPPTGRNVVDSFQFLLQRFSLLLLSSKEEDFSLAQSSFPQSQGFSCQICML